ncbi:hypothetical protein EYF80_012904 [Liparis tanakae]|uniref:Uncharacterized protein n=1 Tax=Liparis tanakae TaxID=230148 RepID=A0A4Z2IGF9_9TELE|nr:hypothetical protein EYF80_012904 [Liparis tanakae]
MNRVAEEHERLLPEDQQPVRKKQREEMSCRGRISTVLEGQMFRRRISGRRAAALRGETRVGMFRAGPLPVLTSSVILPPESWCVPRIRERKLL